MSQAPKCRLCEERHYGLCPGGYKRGPTPNLATEPVNNVTKSVTKRPVVTKSVTKTSDLPVTKSVTKSDKGRVYAWREKNRARYNEKQKELMRKRTI